MGRRNVIFRLFYCEIETACSTHFLILTLAIGHGTVSISTKFVDVTRDNREGGGGINAHIDHMWFKVTQHTILFRKGSTMKQRVPQAGIVARRHGTLPFLFHMDTVPRDRCGQ